MFYLFAYNKTGFVGVISLTVIAGSDAYGYGYAYAR